MIGYLEYKIKFCYVCYLYIRYLGYRFCDSSLPTKGLVARVFQFIFL